MKRKTIIIGSGIVGASIAYHLVTRGVDVSIMLGPKMGGIATASSFGWINAASGNCRSYFDFRLKAIRDWHSLQRELCGKLDINWRGSLWWHKEMDAVIDQARQLASWGYPIQVIPRSEIRRREPLLRVYPDQAVFSPMEGAISAYQTSQVLLEAAIAHGATIVEETASKVIVRKQRIAGVWTTRKFIKADQIVVAAGTASQRLLGNMGVDVPMKNVSGFLVQSGLRPSLLKGIVLASGIHMRQDIEGHVVAGSDGGGENGEGINTSKGAEKLMRTVQSVLMDDELSVETVLSAVRPIPADGLPIMGPSREFSGLYVAVMHSGVTLGALAGRLIAQEIICGTPVEILEPYRLERFDRQRN